MSICYSQDFKDSLVKLNQEGSSLKSLAEKFGPSKYSMAIWVKQAIPIIIKGQSKTLKDVKKLEKGLAILEEKNAILKRAAILLAKKQSVMWDFPLVNPLFNIRIRTCTCFKCT